MDCVDATEVRRNFVGVADRVRTGRERLIVQRNGRDLVAIVPVEDALALAEAKVAPRKRRLDREAIWQIVESVGKLPVRDPRAADEIIGYDELGLPT